MHIVYFDGSSEKLCAVVDNEPHFEVWKPDNTNPTHIEFRAFIYALSLLPDGASVIFYSDSQILVAQMNSDLYDPVRKPDCYEAKNLIGKKALQVSVRWVGRRENLAGKLLK